MKPYLFPSGIDPRVAAALEYISRQRLSTDLNLQQLAASFNLSFGYFRQLFKYGTGLSIARYLKAMRLQRAHEMLQATHLSVKEVRFAVGFSDHSHFTRDYKHAFGESPSQTRWGRISANRP